MLSLYFHAYLLFRFHASSLFAFESFRCRAAYFFSLSLRFDTAAIS